MVPRIYSAFPTRGTLRHNVRVGPIHGLGVSPPVKESRQATTTGSDFHPAVSLDALPASSTEGIEGRRGSWRGLRATKAGA